MKAKHQSLTVQPLLIGAMTQARTDTSICSHLAGLIAPVPPEGVKLEPELEQESESLA